MMVYEDGKEDFSEGLTGTIDINIQEGKDTISLEAGFERLESIVKALEQKDLPLEKALDYFKVGVALVQHCSTVLNQAEKQMQVLLEDPDGQLQYQPISYDVKG